MDYSYYNDPRSQPFSLYGLPTPDQPNNAQPDAFVLNDCDQNFPGYDPSFRLDPSSSFVAPPHTPPESFTRNSASGSEAANNRHIGPASFDGDEAQLADSSLARSSSEEKESAPAQSKRKAQNRAAQRAFRERKERHARELEDKVTSLEEASKKLQEDNERLKRELAKYSTENEILRATSHHPGRGNINENPEPVAGPMKYTPTDFYSTLMPNGPSTPSSLHHRLTVCPVTGEKLLGTSATWDLIQQHELFKRGQVDIGDVTERLKGMSQCDGQGPAFKESQVRQAIEESAALARDELI